MTWQNYNVHFEVDGEYYGNRYIRATSEADAKWRVVRKFILPETCYIVKVEKVN